MSLNTPIHTWSDGTPKSLTSPFNWQTDEDRARRETNERERERWRVNYQKRKERESKKFHAEKELMRKNATRINKSVHLGAHGGIANALKTKTLNSAN